MIKNLLLTGRPGIGKTTIIRKVAEVLGPEAGGFYTEEVRERGRRIGFRIVTLDGRQGWLAHKTMPGAYRVGKYNVNVKDLEEIGVQAIRHATAFANVVIIDEIGPMELLSPAFKQAVMDAMDSTTPVLATVMSKPHPWVLVLKARDDTEVWEVLLSNRDTMPARVLAWVKRKVEEKKAREAGRSGTPAPRAPSTLS